MLQKQNLPINFAMGLDLKNDPWQISIGNFLALENSVFTTGKRLTKRNGYGQITSLPNPSSFLTTFNGDLTAVGSSIQAYSTSNMDWVSKGNTQPVGVSVIPLIRNNLNQAAVDSAVAPNGLVCTVYKEVNNSTNAYKYVISDLTTGQNILSPVTISTADSTYGEPKVFVLQYHFLVVYTTFTGGSYHLLYTAIPLNNPGATPVTSTISNTYTPATTQAFDGVVFNQSLYIAWNSSVGSSIQMTSITSQLVEQSIVTIDASHAGTVFSACADLTNNTIWVTYYNSGSSTGYTVAVDSALNVLTHFPVQVISSGTILNLASAAQNGINQIFYEVSHVASTVQTNFISSVKVTQSSGAVSSPLVILRSVGLASKAFIINGVVYFLSEYSSPFQPTYFLVNGSISTSANPVVVAKLAYENGGGYLTNGLPSVSVSGSIAYIAYLFKDLVQALANSNSSGTTVSGGIYSQTGINQVAFNFDSQILNTTEIGLNLNITGGFLQSYDGYSLSEQGFHLWPDSVQISGSGSGGSMTAQQYYYQATYEWTDNQGNAFRSAGSIPVTVTTTGSTSSVTLIIPTLRVTAKISNPVKIVIYRWSATNPVFFQVTSITAPILNDSTVDTVTFVDTQADSAIIGNNILYTTGGVIEDIGAPATEIVTIFDDRLWLVDAEDPNLLWYSKQVIQSTPVEMSDLLTIYVNPNVSSTGPTGPITALAPMDDKLVVFKKNAINYINGSGPDNTGANSQFSQPTFVTSMVGCANQRSIVFQPNGLMFEFSSDEGNQIWMLGRGLGTQYIGAPVEALTKNATVLSSIAVPGTNQVRFNLSSGITLMYDYFFGQWGTFSTNGLSSTLFQDLHTYIDPYGRIFQETPGVYQDGSSPVLVSFKTGWISLAGLQGYERLYDFLLLAQYVSPHFLSVQIAYDFSPYALQQRIIAPNNYTGPFGSDQLYGQTTPYGGPGNLEQWRIHVEQQTCQSFQISIQEIFNPFFSTAPGAGFSMSGINCKVGMKKGSRPIAASNSV